MGIEFSSLSMPPELFSAVIFQLSEGVCILDAAQKITILNQSASELLGRSQEELLGKEFHTLIHADCISGEPCLLLQAVHAKEPLVQYETTFCTNRGKIPVICTVSPVTIQNETLFVITFQDISEQKKQEQQTTAVLTRIVEQVPSRKVINFLRILEANIFGMICANIHGRITNANDLFLEMLGYTREELEQGRLNWQKLTPEEFAEKDQATIEQFQDYGAFKPYEKQFIHKDGHRVDVLLGGMSEDDSRENAVVFVVDISVRKQLERNLQESEERFRSMADASPVLIGVYDAQGNNIYYNQTTLDFLAVTSHEEAELAVVPEDRNALKKKHLWAIEHQCAYSHDFWVRRYDGQRRILHRTAAPRFNADGAFVGMICVAFDLTDTRAALARFQRISDSNMIGVTAWHIDGQILDANGYILNMLGYARQELDEHQLNWRKLTPMEFSGSDQRCLAFLKEQGICKPYEKQYIHKKGHRVDILVGSAFMEGSQEEGVSFVLDITERKRMEQELAAREKALQDYTDKLENSNRELEHFATIASHDLQEPLRKVLFFTEHLKKLLEPGLNQDAQAEAMDDLGRIRRATVKMQRLINDLLDLSRITRRGKPFQKTDLGAIVDQVTAELSYAHPNIRSRVSLSGSMVIEADPNQMHQMMLQLLDNALKFHKPGRLSQVSVNIQRPNPEQCQISVMDDGLGMNPEFFSKIFDTFVRLNGAAYAGTGIGLTLVKKIVERHRGSITVESKPGEGSVFTVVLPMPRKTS